jgi:long-chain acyl-CoA synthetase
VYEIRSFTLPELVEEGSRRYSGRPALGMVGKEPVRYEELEIQTRRVAALLGMYGIAKGDRVALASESRPEWGISYLGASRAGAVLVPYSTTSPPNR